jgi:hypothetical protein
VTVRVVQSQAEQVALCFPRFLHLPGRWVSTAAFQAVFPERRQ